MWRDTSSAQSWDVNVIKFNSPLVDGFSDQHSLRFLWHNQVDSFSLQSQFSGNILCVTGLIPLGHGSTYQTPCWPHASRQVALCRLTEEVSASSCTSRVPFLTHCFLIHSATYRLPHQPFTRTTQTVPKRYVILDLLSKMHNWIS